MGFGINGLLKWFNGTDDGVTPVNPHTMLGLAGVWYAMSKISGMVGQMPLEVRRKLPGGGSPTTIRPPTFGRKRYRATPSAGVMGVRS